jgi:Dienelactone hydrolase family
MPGCTGRVGAVGFCLGGTLTFLAAATAKPDGRGLDAAVPYMPRRCTGRSRRSWPGRARWPSWPSSCPERPAHRRQKAPFALASATLASCSANVSAKHEVPSVWQRTKYSHGPGAGVSAAAMASLPGAEIGVGGRPATT